MKTQHSMTIRSKEKKTFIVSLIDDCTMNIMSEIFCDAVGVKFLIRDDSNHEISVNIYFKLEHTDCICKNHLVSFAKVIKSLASKSASWDDNLIAKMIKTTNVFVASFGAVIKYGSINGCIFTDALPISAYRMTCNSEQVDFPEIFITANNTVLRNMSLIEVWQAIKNDETIYVINKEGMRLVWEIYPSTMRKNVKDISMLLNYLFCPAYHAMYRKDGTQVSTE